MMMTDICVVMQVEERRVVSVRTVNMRRHEDVAVIKACRTGTVRGLSDEEVAEHAG